MEVKHDDIEQFIEIISKVSDYDFSEYSRKSFTRRVSKILEDNRMSIEQLFKKLRNNKSFLEKIVKEITVNTTEIFRDSKTWQVLKSNILKKYREKEELKIWHIGCSTGQEVYSILILLKELNLFDHANVIATDLNTDVLEIAQKGVYRFREIDEFIENYDLVMQTNPFDDKDHIDTPYEKYININRRKNIIKIKSILLNKPKFLKHDIVNEGNVFDYKFDLIFCRNVLIYFNQSLQNKLFNFFYDNLSNDGALIIGRHEGMLGRISSKFKKTESIYLKK